MKYKLVPVKPTPEMIHAGQMAVSGFPRDVLERWEAMLAAAPDFDRHVIAEVNADDDGYWADILPDRSVHLGQPLYGVMQPAPEVAELLDALTPQVLDWVRCGLAANGRLRDGDHPALAKLRAAIASCRGEQNALEDQRKQGGEQ